MTKKIFTYSLAVAAMLASCNDDFQTYEAGNATGTKGKMVEAGIIGTGLENGDETRAFSPNGQFVWMPELLDGYGKLTPERLNQRVGLCWTGVNTKNSEYGATASAGVNVFTNYEYEHIGWLQTGQTEVLLDECNGEILNGAYIQGEEPTASSLKAEFGSNWSLTNGNKYKARYNAYYYGEKEGKTQGSTDKPLNLGAGFFKTENATVFEGQYVVYFPYTDKFTKGAIIANSPSYFNNVQTGTNLAGTEADELATASKYAFQMGYITHYEGGTRSSRFLTKNYSSFVRLYLYDGDDTHYDGLMEADIKTVILYSPSQGIIYETGVSAASVINNQGDMTKVEKVGTPVTTNALYAHLTDEDGANEGAYVKWNTTSKTHLVTLPVLPQNVEDLKVILINAADKSMEFSLSDADKNWIAGQPVKINLNMDRKAFTNTYYAVDEPTFASALNKINQSTDNSGTIKILRNIDMVDSNNNLYQTNTGAVASKVIGIYKNISIVADDSNKDACITLKGSKTAQTQRIIEQYVPYDNTKKAQLTVNVPVIVEGYGCCDNYSARLNIGGVYTSVEDVITFNKKVTNYGQTFVGGDQGQTKIVFNDDVENLWDTEYVTNVISKYTNKAYTQGTKERAVKNPTFLNSAAKMVIASNEDVNEEIKFNATLKNEGSVNVTSQKALATADFEGTRSLKVYINKIENTGVLAAGKTKAVVEDDVIGGDIQVSTNAIVSVATTVDNKNMWSYINVEGFGNSDTNDGRIDIKGTSVNKGTIDNNGVINLLDEMNNAEGLFVDNLTGQVGGVPVNNGNKPADYTHRYYKGVEVSDKAYDYMTDLKTGIFVAKTATEDRMAFILNDAVEKNSAVIVEVIGCDATNYDFSTKKYQGQDLRNFDVRINSTSPITFVASKVNADGVHDATVSIGHCIDTYSAFMVGQSNILNVEKNVFVRNGAAMTVGQNIAKLFIANDLCVEEAGAVTTNLKNAVHKTASSANALEVAHDIQNAGTITSNRNFIVGNDFNIAATGLLDSNGIKNGTPNTVGRNFELAGKATFECFTTTIVDGTFNSKAGSLITREGITGTQYRATVNVGKLGEKNGTAQGGWPTQM